MIINEWLRHSTGELTEVGVGSARLDCLILLEDEIGRDRAWILANPEHQILAEQAKKLNKKLARRVTHEPLAYIRGFTEFYGRKFKINKRVLEPRPESETMIELLKQLVESGEWRVGRKNSNLSPLTSKLFVADIGTGSGALGITAGLEIPRCEIDLYDIDAACLAVARHNSALHELHLHCYKRDLLNRPARPYDVLLANLPYVPDKWKINEAAAMEPKIAIFGGKDGLDLYRRMFEQIKAQSWQPKYIFTEALPPQHEGLAEIAQKAGYSLIKTQDFIQLFKST